MDGAFVEKTRKSYPASFKKQVIIAMSMGTGRQEYSLEFEKIFSKVATLDYELCV